MYDNKEALKCLREYISASEPKVNKDLSRGNPNSAVQKLDSLFENGENKARFFRGLPSRFVSVNENVYQDLGYISTSKDITCALAFALEEDPTLLVFDLTEEDRTIDVMRYLPDCNNEDEFILQHGLKYRVTKRERFLAEPKTDMS